VRRRLIVFARPAVPGRCKTRLAKRVGPRGAASLQQAFLDDTMRLTRGVDADRVLAVDGDPMQPTVFAFAAREHVPAERQVGDDLGARMHACFVKHLDEADAVAIVGSDAPTLDPAMIARAFDRLDGADVVLGPADDGGYWLVGARGAAPPIFDGVPWGTEVVLAETLARGERAGLRVALADRWWDVDEPADLERLRRALADDPTIAPATRAALALRAW
jgi:rSAM/selenodomain-associated transferase 1